MPWTAVFAEEPDSGNAFGRPQDLSKNPIQQGCLYNRLDGWQKKRVCSSDDPPDAAELGICRVPEIGYPEIRLFGNNWESVWFENWIIQIILSEILDVPTSTETGKYSDKANFYNAEGRFEYGNSWDLESLTKSYEVGGDCTLADKAENDDDYETCAHFCPEVWDAQLDRTQDLIRADILEPSEGLGVLGQEAWFMPRVTAEKDPSLLNYLGMQGEENRRKLAETFLRPTTWRDYCHEVSLNNCTSNDGVAKRYPEEHEEDRMHVEGMYTGHFRKTDKNDW